MARPRKPGRVAEPAVARKNMDMDVSKLDAARRILGARTDTETVDRALDAIIFQGEVAEALDRLVAAGGLADVYPRPGRAGRPRSTP
jgi:hypothetical protein